MSFFDRFERRCGWLAFPGFLRFYALFHVLVYVLQWIRPDVGQLLDFDRDKILAGEVWRVATMFFASAEMGRPSLISLLFLIFVVNFIFMVGDGLEGAWGTFRASIFYYTGVILILAANFLYPRSIPYSGTYLYVSAFLAFATLFPKVEILLFMILPVQVRFLGIFTGVMLAMMFLGNLWMLPFGFMALANYFLWAAIPVLRGTSVVLQSGKRKRRFNSAKMPDSEPFHTCARCDRTDRTDPYLEFRIGADGKEYCVDHLPQ